MHDPHEMMATYHRQILLNRVKAHVNKGGRYYDVVSGMASVWSPRRGRDSIFSRVPLDAVPICFPTLPKGKHNGWGNDWGLSSYYTIDPSDHPLSRVYSKELSEIAHLYRVGEYDRIRA